MKVIARCMLLIEEPYSSCYEKCSHCVPHERTGFCITSSKIFHECDCIPLPLEMIMKEIIKEEER